MSKSEEELKSKVNIIEVLVIILITIVYVMIMYAYMTGQLNFESKETEEIQQLDLTYDQMYSACPSALLLDDEISVLQQILQKDDIKQQIELNSDVLTPFEVDDFQELYDTLSSNLTLSAVAVVSGSVSIAGYSEDDAVNYKIIYKDKDNFSKVINTLDDPSQPYYLNENNQIYNKVIFPDIY